MVCTILDIGLGRSLLWPSSKHRYLRSSMSEGTASAMIMGSESLLVYLSTGFWLDSLVSDLWTTRCRCLSAAQVLVCRYSMWTRGCCGIALGSLVLDTEDTAVLCASALDLSFDLMLVSFHVPVYQHWKTPASNFDVPSAAVLGGSIVYGTNDAYLKQQGGLSHLHLFQGTSHRNVVWYVSQVSRVSILGK